MPSERDFTERSKIESARLLLTTIRDQPLRVIAFIGVYPLLATITFILPLETSSVSFVVAGLIWFLGLFVQLPKLEEAYDRTKEKCALDKKITSFNDILHKFEDRFAEDFLDLDKTEREENLVPYCWDAFDDGLHRWVFLVFLQQSEEYNLKRGDMPDFNRGRKEFTDKFNFHDPSEHDLKLAWGVYQILCTDSSNIRLDGYTDQSFLHDSCFQEQFIQEYVDKKRVISELKEQKEEAEKEKAAAEDYRETLAQLYEQGKLDKYGIREALGNLEEHIEEVIPDKTHYFILLNKVQEGNDLEERLVETLQRQDIDVFNHDQTYFRIGMEDGYGAFRGIIAVSEEDYPSKEFYNQFIQDHLEDVDSEGYLSVHKAEFRDKAIIEDTYRQREPSFGEIQSLKARQILTTGQEKRKIAIRDELIENYLTTDQLLSVLPLNLFLDNLDSDKKNVLIENNEDIKEWADIERLTDWANPPKTTEEIAEYIQKNYFPEDTVDYWEENVLQIQSRAEAVRDAVMAKGRGSSRN